MKLLILELHLRVSLLIELIGVLLHDRVCVHIRTPLDFEILEALVGVWVVQSWVGVLLVSVVVLKLGWELLSGKGWVQVVFQGLIFHEILQVPRLVLLGINLTSFNLRYRLPLFWILLKRFPLARPLVLKLLLTGPLLHQQ